MFARAVELSGIVELSQLVEAVDKNSMMILPQTDTAIVHVT